jgi:hypothetical protein
MRAELKRLHSPDAADLRSFEPSHPQRFSLFVQAMVGPAGEDSYESFDFTVASPDWIRMKVEADGPIVGFHHVIVAKYDYAELVDLVTAFCASCEGNTWQEVAAKVGRLGRWEFDDYAEHGRGPLHC